MSINHLIDSNIAPEDRMDIHTKSITTKNIVSTGPACFTNLCAKATNGVEVTLNTITEGQKGNPYISNGDGTVKFQDKLEFTDSVTRIKNTAVMEDILQVEELRVVCVDNDILTVKPSTVGSIGQVLASDGLGNLSFSTPDVGGVIYSGSSGTALGKIPVFSQNDGSTVTDSSMSISGNILEVEKIKADAISEKNLDQGVNIEGVLSKDSNITCTEVNSTKLETDTISEKTLDQGVSVEGVVLKDSSIISKQINSELLETDTISEKTLDKGVTVSGVVLQNSHINSTQVNSTLVNSTQVNSTQVNSTLIETDTISEKTLDEGVKVDSMLQVTGDIVGQEIKGSNIVTPLMTGIGASPISIMNPMNMNLNLITNVSDPVGLQDVVTMNYIEITKDQPLGLVSLLSTGKINTNQIPSLAISDIYSVADEAERSALTNIQSGDVCIVASPPNNYIWVGNPSIDPSPGNWVVLAAPSGTVSSVNTIPGPAVTLGTDDIDPTGTTNYYYTPTEKSKVFNKDGSVVATAPFNLGNFVACCMGYPLVNADGANKQYVDDKDFLNVLKTGSQMSGNLDMNTTNKVVNMVDPTSAQDGATKKYVDDKDFLNVLKTGSQMSGNLDMNTTNKVVNMVNPTSAQDAATKKYVDDSKPIGSEFVITDLDSLVSVDSTIVGVNNPSTNTNFDTQTSQITLMGDNCLPTLNVGSKNTVMGSNIGSNLNNCEYSVFVGSDMIEPQTTTATKCVAVGQQIGFGTDTAVSSRYGVGYNLDLDTDFQFKVGDTSLDSFVSGNVNQTDLGVATNGFKDLYLTGNLTHGGVFAINSKFGTALTVNNTAKISITDTDVKMNTTNLEVNAVVQDTSKDYFFSKFQGNPQSNFSSISQDGGGFALPLYFDENNPQHEGTFSFLEVNPYNVESGGVHLNFVAPVAGYYKIDVMCSTVQASKSDSIRLDLFDQLTKIPLFYGMSIGYSSEPLISTLTTILYVEKGVIVAPALVLTESGITISVRQCSLTMRLMKENGIPV
jgi:hypothetical protein